MVLKYWNINSKILLSLSCYILIIMSGLFLNFAFADNNEKDVRVGTYQFHPLIFIDNAGSAQGIFVDLIREIANKEDWHLKFVQGSWSECLNRGRKGEIELIASIIHLKEREDFLDFPNNYVMNIWGQIYVHKDTIIQSILDFEGKTVAVLKDGSHASAFMELANSFGVKCKYQIFDSFKEVAEAVSSKKVIAGVFANIHGYTYEVSYPIKQTQILFNLKQLKYATAKGTNPNLIKTIDQYLTIWKADKKSVYYQILDKWFGLKEKEVIPHWFKNFIYGASGALIFVVIWIFLLKYQVRLRTKKLIENEEKYRILFERESDAIFIYDPDTTKIIDANQATTIMYGYNKDELIGMSCLKFSAEVEESKSAIKKISKKYKINVSHRLHSKKDGTVFFVDISGHSISIGGKNLMYAVSKDITKHKHAEDNLLKNQYYLIKAQEIGKIGTWEFDIQKNTLIWTDENYKIFGVPLGTELTYEIFLNFIHPDDRDYVYKKWSEALNNEPYDIMHRIIVDDTVKWVREKADIKFDEKGNAKVAIGFTQDLTEFKQIENALIESENRFRLMFERTPLSYQSLDENGNFTEVNQTWIETMGYEREEVLGKNFSEFLVPEWESHFVQNFSRFKAVGEVLGVEFEMVKKDGSVILVSFHGKIGENADGTFKQTHCIFNDVTKQRRLEEEKKAMEQKMTQIQKIESIGSLAGGIAHDFNNILFPIVGMSEILMEDLPKGSQEYESAHEILMAGKRGSDLVKQILSFSHQHEHKLIPIRIEKILRETMKLSRSTIPTDIEINDNIQQNCGFVMADPTQMHQVAMNLITNAFHAVENINRNGKIDIELKGIDLKNEEVPDSLLQLGRYIKLSVSDNGVGMSQSITNKIFEPYFTTKDKGKGTGLGLAVVYGIIKELKGEIKVYSEEGKGTTFNIYLPLVNKATEAVPVNSMVEIETGTERILLVDDEEPIVRLESAILKRLGYQVTTYSNSENALTAFKTDPEKYDLVITDMTMPNMTGDKLAKEILSIKPDIPIIICTGFSERINKEHAEVIGVKGFLMKPVVKLDIAQMVRKVLDEAKVS